MWIYLRLSVCLYFAVIVNAGQRSGTPRIVEQPSQNLLYKENESVRLPCVAEGSPPLRYTWRRNNILFQPAGNDDRVVQVDNEGTLIFVRPEDKDEGIFQCFAANSYGISVSQRVKFRMAVLKEFASRPDVSLFPMRGQPLTLNCVPPESIPIAYAYWVVKDEPEGLQPVLLNDRVTMDLEHRLRFTHVTPGDEMMGKPYACLALNSVLRKSVLGPQYFIHPQGQHEEARPTEFMWASPTDELALRGENKSIKCIFSGNPTPNVRWERVNGTSLPNNTQVQSFGQELMFQNIRFEDAGTYKCLATNPMSASPVERQIDIRVESRPYWLTEPQGVEVIVGGTAQFHCHADGVPPPMYFWYVNGVPLEDVTDMWLTPERFQRPSPDRIVFSDLTMMDSMVFQCNATNKHGYLFADFSLDVDHGIYAKAENPPDMGNTFLKNHG